MRTLLHGQQPPSTPNRNSNEDENMMTEQDLNSFYDPLDTLNKRYPEN